MKVEISMSDITKYLNADDKIDLIRDLLFQVSKEIVNEELYELSEKVRKAYNKYLSELCSVQRKQGFKDKMKYKS